jgi:hypothetical protein
VTVAFQIAELAGEARSGRVAQVEYEAPSGVEPVGEQPPVGCQLVLDMVRHVLASGHRQRGD